MTLKNVKYELEPTLATLKIAIMHSLDRDRFGYDGPIISWDMMMELVYNQKEGEAVYNLFKETINEHIKSEILPRVLSVVDRLQFLSIVNKIYSKFRSTMDIIAWSTRWLNSHYVREQQSWSVGATQKELDEMDEYMRNFEKAYGDQEGYVETYRKTHERIRHWKLNPTQYIEKVQDMGLCLFRDEVIKVESIASNLRKVLLEMVTEERAGGTVNWSEIKCTRDMLAALSIGNNKVYEDVFETHFLEETATYYQQVGQKILAEKCAILYVKKVEHCFDVEIDRGCRYLDVTEKKWSVDMPLGNNTPPAKVDTTTRSKLMQVLKDVLISQQVKTVVDMEGSGLKALMRDEELAEMHHLYVFLRRVPCGIDAMVSCISEYLRTRMEKLDETAAQNPVRFIKELMNLKRTADYFLKTSFDNEIAFKNVIQSHFTFFLNKDNRRSEYLAIYIDSKLRKDPKLLNDTELETIIDRCMTFFRFLTEKYAFKKYYMKLLEKRLLCDLSVSENAEKKMIDSLRKECGKDYTENLDIIYRDKADWTKLNADYKKYCMQYPHQLLLDVRVLTAGVWTIGCGLRSILPVPCRDAYDHLKAYYTGSHRGRRITVNPLLGWAEIEAYFYGQQESEAGQSSRAIQYHTILKVDTPTMIILLQFNDRPILTFKELKASCNMCTQLPEKILRDSLESMSTRRVAQRILTKKGGEEKEISESDEFSVNDLFTSKLTRICIANCTEKSEARPENNEIDSVRILEVETAVVRIMKARKNLQHNDLVVHVTEQLHSRFKPDPLLIKMSIESLIERKYLKRSEENNCIYEYEA